MVRITPDPVAPVLGVTGLSASYGPVAALRDVSLEVFSGELVALLGSNGAGKSTLLRAVAGVGARVQGDIRHRGVPLSGWSADRRVRGGIALVPEGRRLFQTLTVAENLRLGAVGARGSRSVVKARALVEELFPLVVERANEVAGRLSGGQQQQVAIARALMSEPDLLLLDEPSLGLSPNLAERVFDAIAAMRDRGLTILLVEQNVTRALEIADRAYVLSSGQIVQSGRASDIGNEHELAATYFGVEV